MLKKKKKKNYLVSFTDTDWFQMCRKYKLYLPIDHEQNSAGSRGDMKKKEKHIS